MLFSVNLYWLWDCSEVTIISIQLALEDCPVEWKGLVDRGWELLCWSAQVILLSFTQIKWIKVKILNNNNKLSGEMWDQLSW